MLLISCGLLISTVKSSTFLDVLTLGGTDNSYDGQLIDVGRDSFNDIFRDSSNCPIIRRICKSSGSYSCVASHQTIYYKRLRNKDSFDAYGNMKETWSSIDNVLGIDFNLYSSLQDVLSDTNAWTYCNYDDEGIGSFRDCGPTGPYGAWTADATVVSSGRNVIFSIYNSSDPICPAQTTPSPTTAEPTTVEPTTASPTTASPTVYSGEYIVDSGVDRTGDEAKAYCNSLGLTLATVITSQDLTNLYNAVVAAGGDLGSSVWIGLRDDAIEGVWRFEDGTSCPESSNLCMGPWDNANGANGPKWGNGEPNNVDLGPGGEDCGELYVDPTSNIYGWINDLPCTPYSSTDWRRSNTACNKMVTTTTTSTTTYTDPDCDKFIYVNDPKSFEDAQSFCISEYGTSLAGVNQDDISQANCVIIDPGEPTWIGLYSQTDPAFFEFVSGEECDIPFSGACIDFWGTFNKEKRAPKCLKEGGYECGYYRESSELVYNNLDCETKAAFLCEKYPVSAAAARIETLDKINDYIDVGLSMTTITTIAAFILIVTLIIEFIYCLCKSKNKSEIEIECGKDGVEEVI